MSSWGGSTLAMKPSLLWLAPSYAPVWLGARTRQGTLLTGLCFGSGLHSDVPVPV